MLAGTLGGVATSVVASIFWWWVTTGEEKTFRDDLFGRVEKLRSALHVSEIVQFGTDRSVATIENYWANLLREIESSNEDLIILGRTLRRWREIQDYSKRLFDGLKHRREATYIVVGEISQWEKWKLALLETGLTECPPRVVGKIHLICTETPLHYSLVSCGDRVLVRLYINSNKQEDEPLFELRTRTSPVARLFLDAAQKYVTERPRAKAIFQAKS